MHLKIGVRADGRPMVIALRVSVIAGAYLASGWRVTRRIGRWHSPCPHARFEGTTVYTPRPAGGSFRGLGVSLGHFALAVAGRFASV